MAQFSIQDQKRITFLSLLSSAVQVTDSIDLAYVDANEILQRMEDDGFFEEAAQQRSSRPTSAPRGRSDRPASRGQRSNSGDRPFSGYKNPDAPATEKQINAAIKLGADYTDEELESMTMAEIGGIISDLKG